MGLITVPALEYILEQGSYYELLRDHIAYYSFRTLRRLLERNGFLVLEEEMVNRDTISMIVKKAPEGEKMPEGEMAPAAFSDSLLRGYEITLGELEELAGRLLREGRTLAVWGASHQGFTLASTTCLGRTARYMIDSAPFKQGKYAPASHLPIVSPDHYKDDPTDVLLIVAPGYTEEIAACIRTRFGTDVKILTLRSDKVEELS